MAFEQETFEDNRPEEVRQQHARVHEYLDSIWLDGQGRQPTAEDVQVGMTMNGVIPPAWEDVPTPPFLGETQTDVGQRSILRPGRTGNRDPWFKFPARWDGVGKIPDGWDYDKIRKWQDKQSKKRVKDMNKENRRADRVANKQNRKDRRSDRN